MTRWLSLSLALALTACSGSLPGASGAGGANRFDSNASTRPVRSHARGSLVLRVHVPRRRVVHRVRVMTGGRPHYISVSTQGLTIALAGPTPVTETIGLTPGSPGCSSGTCTVTIPSLSPCQTAGCYTATIATYDKVSCAAQCAIPASAQLLSEAAGVALTIVAGKANAASFTLDGIPAALSVPTIASGYLQSNGAQLSLWGAQPQSLTLIVLDADGNAIVGPGAPTITASTNSSTLQVTQGSTYGALTLRATTTGSPAVVTPGTVTLTVTATPLVSGSPPVSAGLTTVVAHSAVYATLFGNDAIDVFYDGNASLVPNLQIAGSNTSLDGPQGIAVGPDGSIYVASVYGYSVEKFAAGSNGNATPVATISGSSTNLNYPTGLAFDVADNLIWVSNNISAGSLVAFPAFESGNTMPLWEMKGSGTTLSFPYQTAVDSQGRVYVANSSNEQLLEFPATSSGDVPPLSSITTAHAGTNSPSDLDDPTGIALDSSDNVYAANQFHSQALVLEFPPGGFGTLSPIRAISETNGTTSVTGIAIDAAGQIWVGDGTSLKEYAADASGTATPLETIALPVSYLAVVPAATP